MQEISGVMAAAVTPRRKESTQIDLGAALDVIDYLSASGVAGIVLLGATGEFVHFDMEDRLRLIALAIKRSRVPVLVNVSHSCLEGALRLAEEAAAGGAAGLLLMPPLFYRYEADELDMFFRAFAEEADLPAPLLLYQIPACVSGIPLELAGRLIEQDVVAGIADAGPDTAYLDGLLALRRRKPFPLLAGNDLLCVHARSKGASGAISAAACAIPELMVALDRAVVAGDEKAKQRLHARLLEFIEQIDAFPAPTGIREAVALRGLKTGPHPIEFAGEAARALNAFRQWFPGWLAEVQKEAAHG